MHSAYILVGSNIAPLDHTQRAILRLREFCRIVAASRVWETEAFGNPGASNFLNLVLHIETDLDAEALKTTVLRLIETELGRVRTADKNASRTIDLDLIIFNDQVLDPGIWQRAFIALPLADLLPDLRNPQTGLRLDETAHQLHQGYQAFPLSGIQLKYSS